MKHTICTSIKRCFLAPLGRMAAVRYLVSHERVPLGSAIYTQSNPKFISLLRLLFLVLSPVCGIALFSVFRTPWDQIRHSSDISLFLLRSSGGA
ncbi:hypothetical protein VTN77DRAFT_3289 [Rasamsonia byssochlamydoides]|uniref:uncharacterized protein n=1 Tax=Rasamsonia byssochlamydoides TaxID=89139 RepID=UPI00374207F1